MHAVRGKEFGWEPLSWYEIRPTAVTRAKQKPRQPYLSS